MSQHGRAAGKDRREAGFSLIGLVASVTIMLILMAAATPTWKYLIQDDREEELLFRGISIARAIERHQKKTGNALPPSLEVLVQGKHLRKLYKDPMTRDGKWRLVRQGEAVGPTPLIPGASPSPTGSPSPVSSPPGGMTGTSIGVVAGVASTSTQKAYRVFNGRTRYNEWLFVAGQPRIIGRQTGVRPLQANPNPFASPGPAVPAPSPSPR